MQAVTFCDFRQKGPRTLSDDRYNEINLILINDPTMLIQLITTVYTHCHEIYHWPLSNTRGDGYVRMK
jgi:hypothetical protein